MDYKIKYDGRNLDAQSNSTVKVDFELQKNSIANETMEDVPPDHWASFEYNTFRPRATNKRMFYDRNIDGQILKLGIVSSVQSDSKGYFSEPLNITVDLPKYIDLYGIHVFSSSNIAEGSVTSNLKKYNFQSKGNDYFLNEKLEDTNQIVISILRIEPFRFLHISKIELGMYKIFSSNEISNIEINREVSLNLREFPASTLNFDVNSSFDLFEINKPISVINNQGARVSDYFIKGGIIGYDTINSSSIECVSVADRLETEFLGDFYQSIGTDELLNLIVGVGQWTIVGYDKSEYPRLLYGHIPITTKRKALNIVAAAINCIIDDRYSDNIRLFRSMWPIGDVDCKLSSIISNNYENNLKKPIEGVDVSFYQYIENNEEMEAYNWYLSTTKETIIKFSEPLHSVKAYKMVSENEKVETSAVTFKSLNHNYCSVISSISSEKIIIAGKKFTTSIDIVSKRKPHISSNPNVENVTGITMQVSSYNTQIPTELVNYLFDYYTRDKKVTLQLLEKNVSVCEKLSIPIRPYFGIIEQSKIYSNGITEVIIR